jgi:hypothetical protein
VWIDRASLRLAIAIAIAQKKRSPNPVFSTSDTG